MLARGALLGDGRYRLEEVVGRGGMAVVWRARDLQLERDVAIKVISDVLAGDESFLARFEREARLAAGLNHPNLVKLFDYSVEDDRPYLVMEYISGGTLARGSSPEDPVQMARDLLDALAHIHGAGILHRDVKPANVLLDAAGAPRLTDFGIARSEEQTGLTQTGQVLGTLRYIAPEVAAGEPATQRSDLYSLGVLLSECAGDEPPPELAALLPRLSAQDRADRPASAADALAELDPTRLLPADRTGDSSEQMSPGDSSEQMSREPAGSSVRRAAVAAPHIRIRVGRGQLIGAAATLVVLLALVAVAALSGGDDPDRETRVPRPAAAGAPVDQQIDRLEQIVRAAKR